ncbi:MAG: TMEM143 family protein [Planctomycetota bacterium]|nr:TMEM143 family protein [Planctomycetota bacterium]
MQLEESLERTGASLRTEEEPVTRTGSSVRVDHECFIPVSKHRIKRALLDRVSGSESENEFRAFLRLFDAIYHFEYHDLAESLKSDFDLFDPSGGWDGVVETHTEEELFEAEERFLDNFMELMEKGNFIPLYQEDVDVAENEAYLFNLPIEIDWSRLDQAMLSRYFATRSYGKRGGEPPKFAQRILIFRRGMGIDTTTGLLLLEKVDYQLTHWIEKIWSGVSFLLGGWRRQKNDGTKGPGGTQGGTSQPKSSMHTTRYVRRITLADRLRGWKSFLRPVTIQEPTYRQLILLFRFQNDSKKGAESVDRGIHIKIFRDIPMADLEVVFPEKKLSMKPADLLKLVITGVSGVVIVAVKFLSQAILNPVVALFALGSLGGYGLKTFLGWKRSRDRYESMVTDSLYHKSLDTDRGVIFYLVDSLESQEFKESALAYFMLWTKGSLSEEELDRECELFLRQEFGVKVDFEVEDALEKIEREGLVIQKDGRYEACPLAEALQRLDYKWDNYFQFNQDNS